VTLPSLTVEPPQSLSLRYWRSKRESPQRDTHSLIQGLRRKKKFAKFSIEHSKERDSRPPSDDTYCQRLLSRTGHTGWRQVIRSSGEGSTRQERLSHRPVAGALRWVGADVLIRGIFRIFLNCPHAPHDPTTALREYSGNGLRVPYILDVGRDNPMFANVIVVVLTLLIYRSLLCEVSALTMTLHAGVVDGAVTKLTA
jgi:hypothetical protein